MDFLFYFLATNMRPQTFFLNKCDPITNPQNSPSTLLSFFAKLTYTDALVIAPVGLGRLAAR